MNSLFWSAILRPIPLSAISSPIAINRNAPTRPLSNKNASYKPSLTGKWRAYPLDC